MSLARITLVPLVIAGSALLCACAPRLHSNGELSAVGRACGVAEGEVVQEAEEVRLLFLYSIAPSRAQLACVAHWSRRHHLHLAYIQAVHQVAQ